MAVYGYDKYGSPTTYGGATFAASGFDLSPINIKETGYGEVTLQWTTPDSSVSYSRIRLVRSATGFPNDETDGANVRETTPAAPSALHTDVGLSQGQYYYYGFFVETDVSTYSSTTVYTRGQVAKSVGGTIYVSLLDGNVGNIQTNTTYWYPTTMAKKWVLAGQAVILTTKRYDFTTRLYQNTPPFYRSGETDWQEPVESAKTSLARASYPPLAKMLSIFGYTLDGIQTKTASLISIIDPNKTPAWYLAKLADHTGIPIEESTSSRTQRVRLRNVTSLARSKGTRLGVQNDITASLGYDATVSVSVNKMLDWDQADAHFPVWDFWDQAGSYAINDIVRYGTAVYRALVANRGSAQGPPNGGSNTWWTSIAWYTLPASTLYKNRYASTGGWVSANRTTWSLAVLTGASNPADGLLNSNCFEATNISGGVNTAYIIPPKSFYIRVYSAAVQYAPGDLVSYGGYTYESKTNSLGVTPGLDALSWQVFLVFVPSSDDPQAIFENLVPITPSVTLTTSYYVTSITGTTVVADCYVDWFNAAGTYISSSSAGTSSAITGGWTRRTVTATAPAAARYVLPVIRVTSAPAGAKFLFRYVQVEAAAAATTWVPPRQVEALIKPDRTNRILNSSFELASGTVVVRQNLVTNPNVASATTNWNAYAGTSGVQSIVRQTGQTGWWFNTTSVRDTWTTASTTVSGGVYFGSNTGVMAVVAGRIYSAMMQVRCSKVQRLSMNIEWYTAAGVQVSVTYGTAVVVAANTVTTFNLSGVTAPATAAWALITVYSTTGTSGTNWAVNDWLEATHGHFEETDLQIYPGTSVAPPYANSFYGGMGAATYQADLTYTWAGTADASISEMRAPALLSVAYAGTQPAISQSSERSLYGSKSLRVMWATGTPNVAAVYPPMPAFAAGTILTLSCYLYVPAGSPDVWISANNTGPYTEFTGPAITVKDQWVRTSVTWISDGSTPSAYLPRNYGATVKGDDRCYVDGALLEVGNQARTYFDGGFPGQEYTFAGTAHNSKSFYYQGLSQKRYRMGDIISRSIPHGMPYSIRYADI